MLFHTAGAVVASTERCIATLGVDRGRMSEAVGRHEPNRSDLVDRVLELYRHAIP
jgi:hypothetical protein